MTVGQVALAGASAVVSAGVVAFAMSMCGGTPAPSRPPEDPAARRPVVVGQARPASVAAALARPDRAGRPAAVAAAADTGDDDPLGLDELPAIADLDRDHPGIAAAHRDATDQAMAASLARAQRRCFRSHALDHKLVEWTGVQSFTVGGDGLARLTGLELIPSTPGIQPLLDCVARDQVGQLAFRVPEGTPATFVVREGGGRVLRSQFTPAQVEAEVAALTERLTAPELSPARRALLEQHLALWRCMAERGVDRRDECGRELDGD